MADLKKLSWPAAVSIKMADLEKLIKKYKFKETLPLVEKIQAKLKG